MERQLEQAKLELELERQNKLATNQQENAGTADDGQVIQPPTQKQGKKKRTPVGHSGWFRHSSTEFDWELEVPAPQRCPHCHGQVSVLTPKFFFQHLQQNIVDNVYWVVSFQHQAARCDDCRRVVEQPGEAEILGSRSVTTASGWSL